MPMETFYGDEQCELRSVATADLSCEKLNLIAFEFEIPRIEGQR